MITGSGEVISGPTRALAGGFLRGVGGMAWGAISGGIQLQKEHSQNRNDWQSNYDNLQNWFDHGLVGVPGNPYYAGK